MRIPVTITRNAANIFSLAMPRLPKFDVGRVSRVRSQGIALTRRSISDSVTPEGGKAPRLDSRSQSETATCMKPTDLL
jgi:hypothetical protein